VPIFLRFKTLCFHINAPSTVLNLVLFLQPVNDIIYSSTLKTSLVFQCGNVNAFLAPFDNGQDSCGCGNLDWLFDDFGPGFSLWLLDRFRFFKFIQLFSNLFRSQRELFQAFRYRLQVSFQLLYEFPPLASFIFGYE